MKSIAMAVLLAALCACAQTPSTHAPAPAPARQRPEPSKVTYAGDDGASVEKAVVILGARNSNEGVGAESDWLRKNYPGYRESSQAIVHVGTKYYSRMNIVTAEGDKKSVFFDITDFYAKF